MKRIVPIALVVLLVLAGLIYWRYFFVYSSSNRVGILRKFGPKGDIFKTYEGEIQQPGLRSVNPGELKSNDLSFSVTDVAVADSLDKCLGKIVKVHYNQYHKSLPWRGENYNGRNTESGQYIVDRIEQVQENNIQTGF
jgi:hypothetical protein